MSDKTSIYHIIFWLLWAVSLILIPFYAFTLLFEIGAIKAEDRGSILSPIIGGLVLVAQGIILYLSYKQARESNLSISQPLLTLVGGTLLIAFMWNVGCSVMGPYSL